MPNEHQEPKRLSPEWHARECDNDADGAESDVGTDQGFEDYHEMNRIAYRDRAAKLRSIRAMQAELAQCRAMMREVEFASSAWTATAGDVACCPWCEGFEPHAAKRLAELENERNERDMCAHISDDPTVGRRELAAVLAASCEQDAQCYWAMLERLERGEDARGAE